LPSRNGATLLKSGCFVDQCDNADVRQRPHEHVSRRDHLLIPRRDFFLGAQRVVPETQINLGKRF
jgi:hypothetical protein